jgi:molybdenum cofactor cytidylyltransferase
LVAGLRAHAGYVGALGSNRTHARRLARLGGLGFSQAELAKIHGPVGVAIGARSPGEIAVAILAELVQVRRAPKRRIGGIILAAGLSSRMGFNKMSAELGGKPLVRHVAEAALAGGLDPVIAVTGNKPAAIKKALTGLDIVYVHNPDYADGLSFSLRRGIEALPHDCGGAMVLLGDMPGIGAGLIAKVKAGFDPEHGAAICVATAHGERGHPVLWGRQFFPEIARLDGDNGARALMAHHEAEVREIEAGDDAPLADIDTRADLDGFSSRHRVK